jgi:exodeoxyribonuclease VII small subunit
LIENAFLPGIVSRVETKATRTLSFEDALAQLESIVESMESGQVPLAELLAKFEDGNKLLKVCEARLKDAELRIEQLAKQKDVLTAFAATEAPREA